MVKVMTMRTISRQRTQTQSQESHTISYNGTNLFNVRGKEMSSRSEISTGRLPFTLPKGQEAWHFHGSSA
jgi:hypothetical protein